MKRKRNGNKEERKGEKNKWREDKERQIDREL